MQCCSAVNFRPGILLQLLQLITCGVADIAVTQLTQFTSVEIPAVVNPKACVVSPQPVLSFDARWRSQCTVECQRRSCQQQQPFRCVGFNYRELDNGCDLYDTDPTILAINMPGCQYFKMMNNSGSNFVSTWILMQNKVATSTVSFTQSWAAYRDGFGLPTQNYWIGNDALYRLTASASYTLRVEIQTTALTWQYAEYSSFTVSAESDKFRLNVAGHSGSAGNALEVGQYSGYVSDGYQFSTPDNDATGVCATDEGWWFNMCSCSNINRNGIGIWATGTSLYNIVGSRIIIKIQ